MILALLKATKHLIIYLLKQMNAPQGFRRNCLPAVIKVRVGEMHEYPL